MNRFLQTLAASALTLAMLSGCATLYRNLEAPTLQLLSVATPGISPDMTVRLTARVGISNPNAVSLPVRGGQLRLTVNDVAVGNASFADGFTVAANQSTVVEIPAALDLQSALGVGLAALQTGAAEIDYVLSGHIDLGVRYLGRIPVNESGRITLNGER